MPDNTEVDTDVDELDSSDDTDHGADGGDNDDPEILKSQLSELTKRLEKIEGAKKDAVSSRDKTKERLREYEAELERYRKEERERKMQRAKKAQDFSAIEKQYQADLREREEQIAALNKQISDGRRAQTRNQLLDAVSTKTGIPRNIADLVLLKAEHEGSFEIPDQVDDDVVDSAYARIRSLAPQEWKQRPTGGAQGGSPGLNLSTKSDEEKPKLTDAQKRVRALAEARNKQRRGRG